MNLITCYMTNSSWYKEVKSNKQTITPKGVLWHSTGANNTYIKRYVQPDTNAKDREELLEKIGKNSYNNDYNHINSDVGVSFFIGKLKNGSIATVQAGPDNFKQWGCGGALNNTHIQFEICEDGLADKKYFEKVYKEAVELTAYLCKKYKLNPKGTFTYNGKKVPVITDHAGSYDLGMGSNHGDVGHWFKKYLGEDYMTDIINAVQKKLNELNGVEDEEVPIVQAETKIVSKQKITGSTGQTTATKTTNTSTSTSTSTSTFSKGDIVKITGSTYYTGKTIPAWIKRLNWIVSSVSGDRVIIDNDANASYSINSPIKAKDLKLVSKAKTLKKGGTVKLTSSAVIYGTNNRFAAFVYSSTLYVREINGNKITVSTQKTGAVTGCVDKKYLIIL